MTQVAIARVSLATDPAWKDAALECVYRVASQQAALTTEDIWAQLMDNVSTHEHRAMGPIMLAAARAGWIHSTEMWRTSTKASQHHRPLRVWESRLQWP